MVVPLFKGCYEVAMFRDITLSILTAVVIVLTIHVVARAVQPTHPHTMHRVVR